MSEIILEMKNITKEFPGVRALDNVNIFAFKGEVLALVGENGAGKSTLMKILSGVYPYPEYRGEIFIKGKKVRFSSTKDAQRNGISIIHQELNLIQQLTVAENIFLGREPTIFYGIVNWKKLYKQAEEVLKKMKINISPETIVSELSVGKQQLVEIARALSQNAEILILDEPTSALTEKEVEQLFELIRQLKEKKVTMIYISHKLEEVFKIADRVTVLRDGATVGESKISEITKEKLISLMVGREITAMYPKEKFERGEKILEVKNFSVNHPFLPGEKIVKNANFSAYKGEILGIAGLMGSGRSELVTGIFGAFPEDCSGEVYIKGKKVEINSPAQAIKQGIALLTEDRKRFGLILSMSVGSNITLAVLDKLSKFLFINKKRENQLINKFIEKLRIKTKGPSENVSNLSGGTQQKVVVSKSLSTSPLVLFLDEPTRGVDVGAKVEIYNIMNQLVREGISIVMISSDLPELLGMSDRIIVMREGEIVGEFKREEATQEKIMECATGVRKAYGISQKSE